MPTTGENPLVQLDSLYLTTDGMADGTPCKTEIPGLHRLVFSKRQAVQLAIDKTPYMQIFDNSKKGELVSIIANIILKDVYDDMNSAIEAYFASPTTMSLTITGDTGTFNLSVYPSGDGEGNFPPPVEFPGTFNNGRINRVTYNFITA